MPFANSRERRESAAAETAGLDVREGLEVVMDSYLGQTKPLPFLEWSLRVPEPKAGTLNFDAFPFQPAMYDAMGGISRQIVVRKATQVGVSAMTVRWALYEADRNGRTILYVFPTLGDVHDFSDARVTPMFEGSDYLADRARDPFNKGLKKVGIGFVYFRGSENKRGLDSVDADGLALDEYDTLQQKNIPDAERRLSGVLSAGLIRRIGVPSLPQFGISERYDESDQQKWLVRCEAGCGHLGVNVETQEALITPIGKGWQEIDFWANVDQKERRIVCAGCAEPLNVSKGRWMAQNPEARIPGFHVSRLIVPGIDVELSDGTKRIDEIIRAGRRTAPYEVEVFYNKDLGRPYVSKEARLSPEEIAAAQREFLMVPGYVGPNDVTMGVDVASTRALNVRISEHITFDEKRCLWVGEVDNFDELELLMDRYSVKMAAIDHLPEGRLARAFQQRFPGRVYLVNYATEGQHDVLKVDQEQSRCSLRRTEGMDATVERVRRQKNLLPLDLPDGYVQHMTANVRRVEEDELGKKKVRWFNTRPDDYFQAEVYDEAAFALWLVRLEVDMAGDEVYTRLEDHLEFRRGEVDQLGNNEWRPGPGGSDGAGFYET